MGLVGHIRNEAVEEKLKIEWSYLGRAQTASALQRAESVHGSKSTFTWPGAGMVHHPPRLISDYYFTEKKSKNKNFDDRNSTI